MNAVSRCRNVAVIGIAALSLTTPVFAQETRVDRRQDRQEQRIDRRINGRVRADPYAEGEHGNRGKPGAGGQAAQRVPDVVGKFLQSTIDPEETDRHEA